MADKQLRDLYTPEEHYSTSNLKAPLHLKNRVEIDEDRSTRHASVGKKQTFLFLLAKVKALESQCMTLENTLASRISLLVQQDACNGAQDQIIIFLSNRIEALEVLCKTLENLCASRTSLPVQQDVLVDTPSFVFVPAPASNNEFAAAPISGASVPATTYSNEFAATLNTNASVPSPASVNDFAAIPDPDSVLLASIFRTNDFAEVSNSDINNLQLTDLAAGYKMSDIVGPENMQSSPSRFQAGWCAADRDQSINEASPNMLDINSSTSSYDTNLFGLTPWQSDFQEAPSGNDFGATAGFTTAVASHPRSHHCQQCMNTFKRAGDLRRHYLLHNPRSSWLSCPKEGCGKRFSRNDKLQEHRARWGH